MILMATFLSLTEPICQPPRQIIETLTPVLPSGLVGRPLSGPWSAPAREASPRAAPAATVVWRNSRRSEEGFFSLMGTPFPFQWCRVRGYDLLSPGRGGLQENPRPLD